VLPSAVKEERGIWTPFSARGADCQQIWLPNGNCLDGCNIAPDGTTTSRYHSKLSITHKRRNFYTPTMSLEHALAPKGISHGFAFEQTDTSITITVSRA
jgi:hypothetical protein